MQALHAESGSGRIGGERGPAAGMPGRCTDDEGGRRECRSTQTMTAWRLPVLLIVLAIAMGGPAAAAQPGLFVGITDDAFADHPNTLVPDARDLGLGGFRVSLTWSPGQTQVSNADLASLKNLVAAAGGIRVVVTVYGRAAAAPVDGAGREAYCSYVRDLVTHYPAINDIVIWNEANLGFFWQPQYNADGTSAAPAAYEALLARCWDVLHAAAARRQSDHDDLAQRKRQPERRQQRLSLAGVLHSRHGDLVPCQRASAADLRHGRPQPLWHELGGAAVAQHLTPSHIGEGDLDRLVQALDDGFGGTGQPVPGHCVGAGSTPVCVSIWYLEAGYQTVPGSCAPTVLHRPRERCAVRSRHHDRGRLDPVDPTHRRHRACLLPALRRRVLQLPARRRAGSRPVAIWRVLGRRESKASYSALQRVIGEVDSRSVNCSRLDTAHLGAVQPAAAALVERIEWPSLAAFSSFNEVWTFAVDARADATYRATVLRVGLKDPGAGPPSLTAAGALTHERPRIVTFPGTDASTGLLPDSDRRHP